MNGVDRAWHRPIAGVVFGVQVLHDVPVEVLSRLGVRGGNRGLGVVKTSPNRN